MEYDKLGRKLGIGTRVAARILRERAQAASASPAQPAARRTPSPSRPPKPKRVPGDPRTATRNVTRGIVRGGRGFGRAFWKPFAHAVRALWHEITGVFFAIFTLFFAQSLWRVRGDWQAGPHHQRFIAYLIFTLVFTYFSVTAFASSRRTHR